jgi:hypothetical protein
MAKLHELLAVEADTEGYYKKALVEVAALFKNKPTHFTGHHKTLKLLEDVSNAEELQTAEEEFVKITTTVPSELEYFEDVVSKYLDVVYQKDLSNQKACADIVLADGTTLASNVPATTLLGLESKLRAVRYVFEEIPTLQPGIDWKLDESQGQYIYLDQHPQTTTKTKKSFDFKILTQATDKHPAQVEKWNVDVPVGVFTRIKWSSALSVADKSKLLGKLDNVIQAVKKARQRANEQEVPQGKIAKKLFDYILDFNK